MRRTSCFRVFLRGSLFVLSLCYSTFNSVFIPYYQHSLTLFLKRGNHFCQSTWHTTLQGRVRVCLSILLVHLSHCLVDWSLFFATVRFWWIGSEVETCSNSCASQRLYDELMTLWYLTKIFDIIGKHWRGHKAKHDLETKERPSDEEEGETVSQPLWKCWNEIWLLLCLCTIHYRAEKIHLGFNLLDCWIHGFYKILLKFTDSRSSLTDLLILATTADIRFIFGYM